MSNALELFSFTLSLASFFEVNLSFNDGASSISISLSIAPSTATTPDKNSYRITDFFLGCHYKISQLGSTQKKIPTNQSITNPLGESKSTDSCRTIFSSGISIIRNCSAIPAFSMSSLKRGALINNSSYVPCSLISPWWTKTILSTWDKKWSWFVTRTRVFPLSSCLRHLSKTSWATCISRALSGSSKRKTSTLV